MKLRWSLIGVVMGAVMCATGILWHGRVMRAWEHTTFHPDFESDPPIFFAGFGVLVLVVSAFVGIFGWMRRRFARRSQIV